MNIKEINWFEKAAQAWCHESTKHVDMIPELAMVFALMLKEQHDRLTASLAEKDAEIERLKQSFSDISHLAASRLADQEAIERHTRKVVAGECAEISETFRTPYGTHPLLSGVQIGSAIRKKYGVE